MSEWETEKPEGEEEQGGDTGGRGTMTEREHESGEEQIDESGRNPTQRQIDGDEPGPAAGPTEERDEGWEETNDEPAQGEQGQDAV